MCKCVYTPRRLKRYTTWRDILVKNRNTLNKGRGMCSLHRYPVQVHTRNLKRHRIFSPVRLFDELEYHNVKRYAETAKCTRYRYWSMNAVKSQTREPFLAATRASAGRRTWQNNVQDPGACPDLLFNGWPVRFPREVSTDFTRKQPRFMSVHAVCSADSRNHMTMMPWDTIPNAEFTVSSRAFVPHEYSILARQWEVMTMDCAFSTQVHFAAHPPHPLITWIRCSATMHVHQLVRTYRHTLYTKLNSYGLSCAHVALESDRDLQTPLRFMSLIIIIMHLSQLHSEAGSKMDTGKHHITD